MTVGQTTTETAVMGSMSNEQVFNVALTKKEIEFVLHCMLTASNQFDKYFNLLDEDDDDYAECEETSKEFEEIIYKLEMTFNDKED